MRSFLIPLMTFVLFACYQNAYSEEPKNQGTVTPLTKFKTADKQLVSDGFNQFAIDLMKHSVPGKKNYFTSPAGISIALSMTSSGARGVTYDEMAKVLHYPANAGFDKSLTQSIIGAYSQNLQASKQKNGYDLSCANHVWSDLTLNVVPEYQEQLTSDYHASLTLLDFLKNAEQSRLTINSWAESNTRGRIKNLLPQGSINSDTAMVLTNAVYLNADWARTFKKESTIEDTFFVSDSEKLSLPFMTQNGKFLYGETEEVQLLRMSYQGDKMSMIAILPKKNVTLEKVCSDFSLSQFKDWNNKLERQQVIVNFPKFEMSTEMKLGETLRGLGMKTPFAAELADFSGITTSKKLNIDEVFHKTFLKVDEKGTEAAAATAAVMSITSIEVNPEEPKVFKADHPFLILLQHHETDLMLFVGTVVKPEKIK